MLQQLLFEINQKIIFLDAPSQVWSLFVVISSPPVNRNPCSDHVHVPNDKSSKKYSVLPFTEFFTIWEQLLLY